MVLISLETYNIYQGTYSIRIRSHGLQIPFFFHLFMILKHHICKNLIKRNFAP